MKNSILLTRERKRESEEGGGKGITHEVVFLSLNIFYPVVSGEGKSKVTIFFGAFLWVLTTRKREREIKTLCCVVLCSSSPSSVIFQEILSRNTGPISLSFSFPCLSGFRFFFFFIFFLCFTTKYFIYKYFF